MNRVVHFEIHASNSDIVQKFYEDVFGWEVTNYGPKMGNYRGVMTGKDTEGAQWKGINGGITPRKGDVPKGGEAVNAFVCTIEVENIAEILAKITQAGGLIALEKMDVPGVGLLAYCKDPDGNLFGVLQPITQQ